MRIIYFLVSILLIGSAIGQEPLVDPMQINNSLPFDKITFNDSAPAVTTHALYSVSGELMWDGGEVIPNYHYYYTGSTGEGLEDFIEANGEGYYYITRQVNITEELNISTEYVCIMGGTGSKMWPARATAGPYFSVQMNSGTAINITAGYVTLDHPVVIFSNASSTATALAIGNYWSEIRSPTLAAGSGKAIRFYNSPFYYQISDVKIEMTAGSAGTAFYFDVGPDDACNGWIRGGMVAGGAYGAYLIEGCPMIHSVYFLNQTKGMYFAPNADYSCGDVWVEFCCFDFISGDIISTNCEYTVKQCRFANCWFYVDNANQALNIRDVSDWNIENCYIKSEGGHGIYISWECNGVRVRNCDIYIPTADKAGIMAADSATITDLMFTGNVIDSHADGYGIVIGASVDGWTVTDNAVSSVIIVPSTSATKILADNR